MGVRCLPATKSPLLSLIEPSIGTLANDKLFDCMANDKHYALSINNGIMRDVALGRVVVREPVCTRKSRTRPEASHHLPTTATPCLLLKNLSSYLATISMEDFLRYALVWYLIESLRE